jgi:non-specific serine/threonine protein kinase
MGQMDERQGDLESARRLFEESLGLYRELGDKWGIGGALYCLGCTHLRLKDFVRARATLEDHLPIAEELGVMGDLAEALEKLGKVAYLQGDYREAHVRYQRSLSLFHALGDKMGIAHCLMDLAGVVLAATPVAQGRAKSAEEAVNAARHAPTVTAAQLLGAAQAILETVGFQLAPDDDVLFNELVAVSRARLGEAVLSKAWDEGRNMTIDEAIACAQTIPGPDQSEARDESPLPRLAADTDFAGLTRREREVAALVSQGKSNRMIAAELVIGERTVESHINNIFTKLDFRSRAQLAAWAVEKRLTRQPG